MEAKKHHYLGRLMWFHQKGTNLQRLPPCFPFNKMGTQGQRILSPTQFPTGKASTLNRAHFKAGERIALRVHDVDQAKGVEHHIKIALFDATIADSWWRGPVITLQSEDQGHVRKFYTRGDVPQVLLNKTNSTTRRSENTSDNGQCQFDDASLLLT